MRRRLIATAAGGLLAVALAALLAGPAGATFPGTNGPIVFSDGGNIAVVDPAGAHETTLTSTGKDYAPAFSPDASKIAFFHAGRNGDRVYLMNADGSGKRALTKGPDDFDPSFSPDGQRIIFAHTIHPHKRKKEHSGIALMHLDGTHLHQLVKGPKHFPGSGFISDQQPSYSADGTHITYMLDFAANEEFDVFVANADGSQAHIVGPDSVAFDPSFAPDSSKVMFDAGYADSRIETVNLDGSGEQRITPESSPLEYGWPSYSPDGTKIVFTGFTLSNAGSSADIYVSDADGSNPVQITHSGKAAQPDWAPAAG